MIAIDVTTGLVKSARLTPSPNCDERPEGELPSLIVIHNISLPPGKFGGNEIEAFFCNQLDHEAHPFFDEIRGVCVSAHLLIRRSGELQQFVPLHQRAWHAGESSYRGRSCCNDYSIGIELEGTDTAPYEEQQYQMLAAVIVALEKTYPRLSRKQLVGHAQIAPSRKTDPGPAFDWSRLQQLIARATQK